MISKESVKNKNFLNRVPALLSLLSLAYLATANLSNWEIKEIIRKRREQHERIKESQGYICGGCGAACELEIHHIVPKSLGGDDDDSNLIALGVSVSEGGCGCHDRWDAEALG